MTPIERLVIAGGVVALQPSPDAATEFRRNTWRRCAADYRDQGYCATPSRTTFRLCTLPFGHHEHDGETHYAESPKWTVVEIWEAPVVDLDSELEPAS